MEIKVCKKCKECKPVEDFGKSKGFKSGYHSSCKLCQNTYGSEHYYQQADKYRTLKKERRKDRFENNICCDCSSPKLPDGKLCEVCTFKQMSPDRTKWELIKNLAEKQNYRCIYTDIKLIIGLNMSVDHIIPKVNGGTDDIDNLQLVDFDINFMKRAHSHDKFVELCTLVATKSGL